MMGDLSDFPPTVLAALLLQRKINSKKSLWRLTDLLYDGRRLMKTSQSQEFLPVALNCHKNRPNEPIAGGG